MKLNGRPLTQNFTRQIEWPRPDGSSIILTLQPLPLGFYRQLRERGITPPTPPTRIARDSSGKPLRDANGIATLVADEFNAEYLAASELYHQRVAVLVVRQALEIDPNIEFETPTPSSNVNWPDYADHLYDELEQSGWSAGDLIKLCEHACRISNLIDQDLRDAHANFSPRLGPPT